ncbi:PREDICTED: uncharacterized protein LOC106100204 [Papilio polytes]|uniref:uncharacterized protein LOC106100204 n=1 Tax=Papilio polytes TaxID=76194 RepID=UPI000676A161|nr:PREDICTED: uncharacterized protein LOC106100204 [Papilio polytes]
MKRLLGLAAARGACHADELFYLFNNAANQAEYEESEKLRALVYNITKLWTDFAKTGEPIPEALGQKKRWPALTATCARGPYVISHNLPNADVSANADADVDAGAGADADCRRVRFWNKLYKDAGLPFIANSTL